MTPEPNETRSAPVTPTTQVGTRLLFENERVRVWDLALAPGEWLESHIHREDFLFVVAAGGHLRHADPNNPGDAHEVKYQDGQVVFIEAPEEILHHRLLTSARSRTAISWWN